MNKVPFQGKRKPLLLHGSAISTSRKKLSQIKEKYNKDNIIVFEKDIDPQQILTNLQSQSLFDGERLIILENPPEDFFNYTLNAIPYTLVLWFDHEIDIKKWPGFEPVFFPESKEVSVFPFLDMLANGDKRAYLQMDKLKKAGFDSGYLLTMTFYLLRNLVTTPKKAPDFVRKKLEKQRIRFNLGRIQTLYQDILEIDFKIKSGLLDASQAEFLLVNKFL